MSKLEPISNILIEKYSLSQADANQFVKEMFAVIRETLLKEKQVKVKGLGTFKLTEVNGRASVDVNTGERIHIEGHTKISFTPENSVRDRINAPFSQFESFDLEDDVDFDKIDNKYSANNTDDVPETSTADNVVDETTINESTAVDNPHAAETQQEAETQAAELLAPVPVEEPETEAIEEPETIQEEADATTNEVPEVTSIEEVEPLQEDNPSPLADIPAATAVAPEDSLLEEESVTENAADVTAPVAESVEQPQQDGIMLQKDNSTTEDLSPVEPIEEEVPVVDTEDQQYTSEEPETITEEPVDNIPAGNEEPLASVPSVDVTESVPQAGNSESLQEELRRTNSLVRVLLVVVVFLVICILAFGAYVYINHDKTPQPVEETPANVEVVDTTSAVEVVEPSEKTEDIVSDNPAEDVEEDLNPHDLRVVGVDKEIVLERNKSLKDIARDNGGDYMRDFIKDANKGRKYFERGDTIIIPKVEKRH